MNSCLSAGPDILKDLTAILICFCCYQHGIIAYIEKSISQDEKIKVQPDSFRYLTQPILKANLMSIENIQNTETKVVGLRWNAKDDVLKLTEERSNTLTTVGKVNKERDITGVIQDI